MLGNLLGQLDVTFLTTATIIMLEMIPLSSIYHVSRALQTVPLQNAVEMMTKAMDLAWS
jgi:hypothetical protein